MEINMSKYKTLLLLIVLATALANVCAKSPVRIKDIATIRGLKDNQLMGFGLITGLNGKGDSKSFKLTQKMTANLASNFGFKVSEEDIKSKNVAAVMVTANISPFSRVGDRVDITLSSIGDAKSLNGGVLLQTALKGADGVVYAAAQGRIIAGGAVTETETTATIPSGALIEKDVVSGFYDYENHTMSLVLRFPDFITANEIVSAILTLNSELKVGASDAGLVSIILPEEEEKNLVGFIARLEALTVTPDNVAMVAIDKKTGVIVAGTDIVIQQCAVSIPQIQVRVGRDDYEKNKPSFEIATTTVGELVALLNSGGLETTEIIALLEAIHKVGALNCRLIIL
jgi:flagellar P-ring protein precursor FlgI